MSAHRRALLFVAVLCAAASAQATPWDDVAHPNHRRCARLIGEASKLGDARQWKFAAQMARTAAALCPSERAVLQSAGETLLGAHELAEGRQRLEQARVLADQVPGTREQELALAFHLGFAREVTGDLDGAVEEHRRLEAMGGLPPPNQYLVHYNLGDELMAGGRLAEAIEEYRRAVTLAPAKPVVRLALAVALDRDEQIDQARAELSGVLAFDPELRSLSTEDYLFVPPADAYYYRALALLERGATAEARVSLRSFLAQLPAGPYAAHTRQRLADAEQVVDPRELEVSAAGIDTRLVARALGPVVGALESCLPAQRVVRVRLLVERGGLRCEPAYPAAECLDRVLSRIDESVLAPVHAGVVTVPLAGRRGAASTP